MEKIARVIAEKFPKEECWFYYIYSPSTKSTAGKLPNAIKYYKAKLVDAGLFQPRPYAKSSEKFTDGDINCLSLDIPLEGAHDPWRATFAERKQLWSKDFSAYIEKYADFLCSVELVSLTNTKFVMWQ